MKYKWKITILMMILMIFIVTQSACSDNNNSAVIEDPANIGQDSTNDHPTSEPQESAKPEDTDPAVADESIMIEFKGLMDQHAAAAELKAFVDKNLGELPKEDYSTLVVALEQVQRLENPILEDRYYNESDMQQKLMAVYQPDFDLNNLDGITDEGLKKLLIDTREAGFKVETAEGAYMPIIDFELYRIYQPNVTDAVRDYIDIMAAESNEVSVKDMGMIITWEEAVQRAVNQEQSILMYPDSPLNDRVKNLFGGYVYITFNGIDNSPLFSYEDGTFMPDVKTAYKNALKDGFEHSPYLQKLNEFVELVNKNGGKKTEAVEAFQQEVTEMWSNSAQ